MNELISEIDDLLFELSVEVPKAVGVLKKVNDIAAHSTTYKYGSIKMCLDKSESESVNNAKTEITVINYLLADCVQEFIENIKPKLALMYEKFNQLSERAELCNQ